MAKNVFHYTIFGAKTQPAETLSTANSRFSISDFTGLWFNQNMNTFQIEMFQFIQV